MPRGVAAFAWAVVAVAIAVGCVASPASAEWTFETVAVTNTPAPGGTVPFLGLGSVPVINDAGNVTFSGTTNPAFGVFNTGLYQRLNGVNLMIIREGDAVPAAGGALIREFDQFSVGRATMNASGDVTFRVELDTTGPGGVTNGNRFVVLKGSAAGLSVVARQGDVLPDGVVIAQVDSLPSINAVGDVGFAATYIEGGSFRNRLMVAGAGGLASRAAPGDPAPGLGSSGSFINLGGLRGLNDAGDIAFSALAHSSATNLNHQVIYKSEGSTLRLIAAQDDPAPGFEPTGSGPRRLANLLADGAVSINAAGRVAFYGEATGFGDNQALFKETSTGLVLVARILRPAPGTGGATFKQLGMRGLLGFEMLAPGLNDAGDIAFFATLQGTGVTSANDQGLWAEINGALQLVVRKGDSLEVAPGDVRVVQNLGFYRAYSGYGLAFSATFTDNSQGIFVARFVAPPPPPPTVSIGNVSITEGNAGTKSALFPVSLSASSTQTVQVSYATANGTALAGSDYVATSGVVTFAPGVTAQTVAVQVNGDVTFEPNETFVVNLSNPVNAVLGVAQGTGTILNDDARPTISIDDVKVVEGHSGITVAKFSVTLSNPSSQSIGVIFRTADKTALAGSDYTAASGKLTFAPGVTSQPIAVSVLGDKLVEKDEIFVVDLSSPAGATIARAQGIGLILNDDAAVGETAFAPSDATLGTDDTLTYTLTWIHPVNWHTLNTIDLRIRDDRGTIIQIRFSESAGTFSLVEGKRSKPVLPGSPGTLETSDAVLDLAKSSAIGTGPTGPSVTLTYGLRFKPPAKGRTYQVEVFATDDGGTQQGWEKLATLTVRKK